MPHWSPARWVLISGRAWGVVFAFSIVLFLAVSSSCARADPWCSSVAPRASAAEFPRPWNNSARCIAKRRQVYTGRMLKLNNLQNIVFYNKKYVLCAIICKNFNWTPRHQNHIHVDAHTFGAFRHARWHYRGARRAAQGRRCRRASPASPASCCWRRRSRSWRRVCSASWAAFARAGRWRWAAACEWFAAVVAAEAARQASCPSRNPSARSAVSR